MNDADIPKAAANDAVMAAPAEVQDMLDWAGLVIDNCASGGRRIDLETLKRSVPFWRSDTSCSPGHPDWNQSQSAGLSLYVPLFLACNWTPTPYEIRSSATGGAICDFDSMNPDFPLAAARAVLAEATANQKFWYGDFYPLTRCTTSPEAWMAYQFHRPDLNAGLVLVFRHAESNYPALNISLRGPNPATTYSVEFLDDAQRRTVKRMTGRKLTSEMELRIPTKPGSLLIRYAPVAKASRTGTRGK